MKQSIENILICNGYVEKTFNHYYKDDKDIIVKNTMFHFGEHTVIYSEKSPLQQLIALGIVDFL